MSTVALTCARCGRLLPVPTVTTTEVLRCARCGPPRGEALYEVRSVSGRASLDEAALLARLVSGQLSGTDWIIVNTRPVLIAAHPAFAGRYARGEIAEPAPVVEVAPPPAPIKLKPVRKPLPWARLAAAALCLAGVGVGGFLWATRREELESLALGASEVVIPTAPGHAVAVTPPPVDPSRPKPDPLASVAAAVGPVEEPIALLTARAIGEWTSARGSPRVALDLARRAVARSTRDADAVALLAVIAATSGLEPGVALLAGQQAVELGAATPAAALGRAALGWSNHDLVGAREVLSTCKADILCRYVSALVDLEHGDIEAGIAALDALHDDWPENGAAPRRAALAAAGADRSDAKARLLALKLEDPEVLGARAAVALRDGDVATATTLVGELGEEVPVAVRLGVARSALAKGDAARALELVQGVAATDRADELGLRLAEAQARYLAANKAAARLPEAQAAVAVVVKLARTDPAVAQVRALVAHMAKDTADEAKAWDSMDTARRSGPELARVLKTEAALMADEHVLGSELLPVAEAARAADPADPYTHVWVIHTHLLGHSAGKALEAMRAAIKQVDGQSARRRSDLVTLETGSPAKALRGAVAEALGNDATFAAQLPLALAVASWLGGDFAGARAALDTIGHIEGEPEALALRARLRGISGDWAGAVVDWEQVVAIRPKEPQWLLGELEAKVRAGRAHDAGPLAELVRASKISNALAPALLAEVSLALGDRAAALSGLKAAVLADPLDIQARARLLAVGAGK